MGEIPRKINKMLVCLFPPGGNPYFNLSEGAASYFWSNSRRVSEIASYLGHMSRLMEILPVVIAPQ